MPLALGIVGNRHRQIGDADTGRDVAVHQQLVAAQAVFAGTFLAKTAVGTEAGGRRNHRPVHVLIFAFQVAQQMAGGVGTVENLLWKRRCIDQLHTGGDVKTARPADDEQIRHLGGARGGKDGGVAQRELAADIRIRPARIEGADHGIKTCQLPGEIGRVHIGLHRPHMRCGEDFIRVAGKRDNFMTTCGKLAHHRIADVTRATNDCNFHKNSVV